MNAAKCTLSPAAAIATSRKSAGASIVATCTSARSRSASATPGAAPKWQWRCGFYPGSRPGECTGGTAETFDQARTAFERAWALFVSKRSKADFQAWRDQRDWTAKKYATWDAR